MFHPAAHHRQHNIHMRYFFRIYSQRIVGKDDQVGVLARRQATYFLVTEEGISSMDGHHGQRFGRGDGMRFLPVRGFTNAAVGPHLISRHQAI